MQPADVLLERALPGNGHGQEQRVQPGIVEAFADVTAGGQDDARLTLGHSGEGFHDGATLLPAHPAPEDKEVGRSCRYSIANCSRWSVRPVSKSGDLPDRRASVKSRTIRSFRGPSVTMAA